MNAVYLDFQGTHIFVAQFREEEKAQAFIASKPQYNLILGTPPEQQKIRKVTP